MAESKAVEEANEDGVSLFSWRTIRENRFFLRMSISELITLSFLVLQNVPNKLFGFHLEEISSSTVCVHLDDKIIECNH